MSASSERLGHSWRAEERRQPTCLPGIAATAAALCRDVCGTPSPNFFCDGWCLAPARYPCGGACYTQPFSHGAFFCREKRCCVERVGL